MNDFDNNNLSFLQQLGAGSSWNPNPANQFTGWGNTIASFGNPTTPQDMTGGSGFLSGLLGNNGVNSLQGLSTLLSGAGALGSAFLGSQMLRQGKKEFQFNKGLAQRNLGNQAQLINTGIERRARSNAASAGLSGSEAENFIEDRKKRESVRGTI